MDHPFRSALFGGFCRQDVLTYLENTAKEAAQAQQQLQQKLDQAQETLSRQDVDLTDQQEQMSRLRQENQELRRQLEQADQALETSRADCARTAQELSQAREETRQWKSQAQALQPDAAAYAAVKERTAGMELQAHQRAQAVEEQAALQARRLREEMGQWMARVEREYDALRTQVEATVAHAADQLDRAGESLRKVSALMEEQEVALAAMNKACAKDGWEQGDPSRTGEKESIPVSTEK